MEQNFINTLFPETNNGYILIWRLSNKTSKFFHSAKEAYNWLDNQTDKNDLYIGTGLSDKDYGGKQRCKAESITGIGGIWLDIDIYDEKAHKKSNLPKTISEAIKIVNDFEIEPTIIVDSGHGLQVWWLFDNVWHFSDEKERKIAARTVEVWNNIAKSYGTKYGYDVDMTHDLARVMRLPGTINAKVVDNPVPVRILSSSDKRYNVSKIKEICADFAITLKGNNTTEKSYVSNYNNINIVVNENADPPFDKFMLLMKNPKFKKSCERNRKDLTDQSPSSYDNSIASFAINAGWTDQEIVDTLIALRRNNNEGNKDNRVDYFQRTIGKLRAQLEENMLVNDFKKEQTLDEKVLSQCLKTKENELRTINERLGLNIKRIIKYVSDPPIFSLEMEDGKSIKLGEVGNLITQKSFIKNIAAVSGIYVRSRKPAVWDIVAALLLKVCEEVEIGDEATDTGSMAEKIAEYLDTQRVYSDAKEAVNRKKPFYDTINGDEYIMISGKEFRRWATTTYTDKMSNQDMGIVFRKLGLSSVTHRVSDKTYKLWVIPKESPLYIEEKNNDEIIF